MIITSFAFCLLIFVVIGILSTLKNRNTNVDYLLAGRDVKPWLVALSAVATNNSGYMFIGMIGYTYLNGLSAIWLMMGWISGDFVASFFVHRKLRVVAQDDRVLSFAGAVSRWNGLDYKKLRFYLGIVTVIFLGTYSAAQLNAGSKALHVLFGWDYQAGAIIGAVIVLLYCFAGGIRASIWTDAAQSFVMMVSMALLFGVSLFEIGGFVEMFSKMQNISDSYVNFFPEHLLEVGLPALFLFVIGWFLAGFGVVGQPHIMVRFMAMDSPKNIAKVRYYYYGFYASFYILTILVGLSARILLGDGQGFDPELALPTLASSMLPDILVGLILAGLFAAIVSTVDSQILSCTASITRDFSRKNPSYLMTKLATIFVTFVALGIALYGDKSVFKLVLISWSSLASSFAPLLIIYVFGAKPSEIVSLLISITGLVSVILWRQFNLNEYVYEIVPGMLLPIILYLSLRFFSKALSLLPRD